MAVTTATVGLLTTVAIAPTTGAPAREIPTGPIPRSVWLYEPDPAALPSVHSRLDEVLDTVDAGSRIAMLDAEVRIHVIPQDWNLTDLPPWSNLRGQSLPDPNPYDSYVETRSYDDLRGLGPPFCISGPLDIAISEESLAALPTGRFNSPAPGDLGKVLVHEVGHGVECSLDEAQSALLDRSYAAAVQRYPSGVVGSIPSYSVATKREYFAEGVVAWFEAAQHESYRRAWLLRNDPALHDLLGQVFAVPAPRPTCAGQRSTVILRPGGAEFGGTPGADVIVGTSGPDVISGGGGDDVICGEGGNDELTGGYGSDRILGGAGNDSYSGGSGADVLDDTSPGAGGADSMDGGPGDDVLAGGAGVDELVDRNGRDRLEGGPGDDTLDARDVPPGKPDRIDGSQDYDTCRRDPDDEVVGCRPRPVVTTTTTAAPKTTKAPAAVTTPKPTVPVTTTRPSAPVTTTMKPPVPVTTTTTRLPVPVSVAAPQQQPSVTTSSPATRPR